MNTFHIRPVDPLAAEVAAEVREYDPDTLIAIRGQFSDWGGDIEETVYTVSACPSPDNMSGYLWEYVSAGDWIAEFDAIQ